MRLLPLVLVLSVFALAACDKLGISAAPTPTPVPDSTPTPTPATPKPGSWMWDKNRGNVLEQRPKH